MNRMYIFPLFFQSRKNNKDQMLFEFLQQPFIMLLTIL